ncbi:2-hydroxyglutaryl-CoA dehydratase [Clostridium sp. P21]|uniref:2-hydroxyglutaryl-CoA dehydratase n=1 Tax=Clostridium muellerianum TaxID=2716538 RepID=A0A7Y0EGF9_9CLOT|nr:2-hydroxyglutaryl-CoA dehydratase [Clostridium muellerianum]NMM62667.1 2-hydroxyglutaryl-CoA dehydratase [Clostridium muellerianum]
MKVTFPHLGNSCFAVKAIFDGLKIDYVIPPFSNKEALEIGSMYSPEEICLPFKIMMGNYIQAIKNGADTILSVGSCGPCRFGEYSELQINILKKLGYNLNFIVLDKPNSIGFKEFINRINKISSESSIKTKEKLSILYKAYKIINLIDNIESYTKLIAGYEINKGTCSKVLNKCKREAFNCNSPEAMLNHFKKYSTIIKNINIDKNKNPLSVAIIGEIYTIIEPFSNLYIEDKLMDYGVSSIRYLSPSWWIKNTLLSIFKINSLDIRKLSKKYIPMPIGGYAKECIGEALLSHKKGCDGAIQIMPMGCMPEIVSKSILPNISREKDLPIMTLVVDEMTGDVGYLTRIEAFLDLLERRRDNVLYGS